MQELGHLLDQKGTQDPPERRLSPDLFVDNQTLLLIFPNRDSAIFKHQLAMIKKLQERLPDNISLTFEPSKTCMVYLEDKKKRKKSANSHAPYRKVAQNMCKESDFWKKYTKHS